MPDKDYIDAEINEDYFDDGIEVINDEDEIDIENIYDATPPKEEKRKVQSMRQKITQKPLTAKQRAKGIKTIIIQTNDGKIIKFC